MVDFLGFWGLLKHYNAVCHSAIRKVGKQVEQLEKNPVKQASKSRNGWKQILHYEESCLKVIAMEISNSSGNWQKQKGQRNKGVETDLCVR